MLTIHASFILIDQNILLFMSVIIEFSLHFTAQTHDNEVAIYQIMQVDFIRFKL